MTPFNQITQQFTFALSNWQIAGIGIAKELFVVLATIQLIWSAALWMFNRDEPDAILIDFVRKMIFLSVFWEILLHYDRWIPAIINSFREAGMEIARTGDTSPGDVFEKGIHLATTIFGSSTAGWGIDMLMGVLTSLVVGVFIFLIFTRIAIEMIIILIGSRIILIGGVIMLGFAGSQWTQKYAERYIASAIQIGIKMLFITLIVGLGDSLSDTWVNIIKSASYDTMIETDLSILGASLVYGYLAVYIPDMAATMLSGELSIGFPDPTNRAISTLKSTAAAGVNAVQTSAAVTGAVSAGAVYVGEATMKAIKELRKNDNGDSTP